MENLLSMDERRPRGRGNSGLSLKEVREMAKDAVRLDPVTPGELLWEEFMVPMGLSRYRLAKEIGVPAPRIGDIVSGKRSVTADTDLRLSRYFGLTAGYWLRAQAAHDIEVAQRLLAHELSKINPWPGSAA
jgi:addiction module HigA family antidote